MNTTIPPTRRKLFGTALGKMKVPLNVCLSPDGSCTEDAIRAHSVQNSRMLEALQQSGHVIAPRLDLSATGARVSFQSVGRNQATTFHGLCSAHDTALFAPIETHDLNLNSAEHLFLLSYRAVLKEAHATRKSARDTQSGYQAGVQAGIFPNAPCPPGMLAVEHMSLAFLTHLHKEHYDGLYNSAQWDALEHFIVDLRTPPSLAVNSLLSTGSYSDATDSLAYATLNVFPLHETTYLVFSHLREHRRQFNRSFKRFLQSGEIKRKLSYLVLKRCENFVLSPKVYDAFSEAQVEQCVRFYHRNVGNQEREPEDPSLIYLFGAANDA